MTIRQEDKEVIIALLKNGCRYGDEVKDLADATGFSVQRLVAVAKRYDGIRFKRFRIRYFAPENGSFKDACPGIKNPHNGICQRVPAEIAVEYFSKKS